MDPKDIILQMHEDWVVREEQFRACVQGLEEVALSSSQRAEELEKEVISLRSLLESKQQSKDLDAERKTQQSYTENKEERHFERNQLQEYLKCSLLECTDIVECATECTADDVDRNLIGQIKEYIISAALPVAFNTTMKGICSSLEGDAFLGEWHDKIVMPIQLLEGLTCVCNPPQDADSSDWACSSRCKSRALARAAKSITELSCELNRACFNQWLQQQLLL